MYCRDIEHLIDADDAGIFEQQIASLKPKFLIAAAEMFTQTLQEKSPGAYRRWLNGSVGKLEVSKPEILDAFFVLGGVLV